MFLEVGPLPVILLLQYHCLHCIFTFDTTSALPWIEQDGPVHSCLPYTSELAPRTVGQSYPYKQLTNRRDVFYLKVGFTYARWLIPERTTGPTPQSLSWRPDYYIACVEQSRISSFDVLQHHHQTSDYPRHWCSPWPFLSSGLSCSTLAAIHRLGSFEGRMREISFGYQRGTHRLLSGWNA